jgi:hypothetical protein
MVVGGHQAWVSSFSVTVTLDKLHDEGDHEGLLFALPTRFHILAT